MDRHKEIKSYIIYCEQQFLESDGTLRKGQIYFNTAYNKFPELNYDKIYGTNYDPFYVDDNIPLFMEFLKKGDL